jgi:hypothetical protein
MRLPRGIFSQRLEQVLDEYWFDLEFPLTKPRMFIVRAFIVVGELRFETDSKDKRCIF